MSEKYLIGKEYLGNAIYRAYKDGLASTGSSDDELNLYVANTIDDMLRGDKPFNEAEIFNKGFNEGLSRCEYVEDRDEFAKAALTGFTAHPLSNGDAFIDAKMAYKYADAMIAERNKQD